MKKRYIALIVLYVLIAVFIGLVGSGLCAGFGGECGWRLWLKALFWPFYMLWYWISGGAG